MSYSPYTPWSSESSQEGSNGGGGWWKNTKAAIKKPWRRKAGSKEGWKSQLSSQQRDPWRKEPHFGAFPPLMAQLNAGLFERRSSDPLAKRGGQATREPATEEVATEDFDLPQYEGQRRPRLDSVFPMRDTPPPRGTRKMSPGGGGRKFSPPRPRAGAAVGRSSSFNTTADSGAREEVDGHRRDVSVDSGGSEDRTLERRKRRMGVVRKLPQLPQRSKVDWNEVHSLPDFGCRQRRPTPVPAPLGSFDMPHPLGPPRGGHNFGFPPWGSPPENLPTLAEESDSGEIRGFDDFRLY